MSPLILGLLLGTLAAVLLRRLRGTEMEGGPSPARAVPAPAADSPIEQSSGREVENPADDLAQLTREQLYRPAQDAGIVGRSEMSKHQLIAALRHAGG